MQQKARKDFNKMLNWRRAKTKLNTISLHEDDPKSYKGHSLRLKMHTQCRCTPQKERRRMATQQKPLQMTIRNSSFRTSQHHFQKEELKDHHYLINLCKNLQTAAFKLRNPVLDSLRYQETKYRAYRSENEELKPVAKKLPTVEKLGISAARYDRKTLKERMRILQNTISGFEPQQ